MWRITACNRDRLIERGRKKIEENKILALLQSTINEDLSALSSLNHRAFQFFDFILVLFMEVGTYTSM